MGIFYDEPEPNDDDGYYYDNGAPADEFIEIPDRVLRSRQSSSLIAQRYGVTVADVDAARRQVVGRAPTRRPGTGYRPLPRRRPGGVRVDHRKRKKRKRTIRVSRSVARKLLGGWFV